MPQLYRDMIILYQKTMYINQIRTRNEMYHMSKEFQKFHLTLHWEIESDTMKIVRATGNASIDTGPRTYYLRLILRAKLWEELRFVAVLWTEKWWAIYHQLEMSIFKLDWNFYKLPLLFQQEGKYVWSLGFHRLLGDQCISMIHWFFS